MIMLTKVLIFSEQLGSLEKALEFYNKPDEATFRDELFKLNKEQKLSSYAIRNC